MHWEVIGQVGPRGGGSGRVVGPSRAEQGRLGLSGGVGRRGRGVRASGAEYGPVGLSGVVEGLGMHWDSLATRPSRAE